MLKFLSKDSIDDCEKDIYKSSFGPRCMQIIEDVNLTQGTSFHFVVDSSGDISTHRSGPQVAPTAFGPWQVSPNDGDRTDTSMHKFRRQWHHCSALLAR